MHILGIDYGEKKIGLAYGEGTSRIAVPLDVVPNRGEETIRILGQRVSAEDIDVIVVGVPLLHGKEHTSEQVEKTRTFIKKLKEVVAIPVEEEDESYTTWESVRLQKEEGAQAKEDALAAMIIVKQYLERLS